MKFYLIDDDTDIVDVMTISRIVAKRPDCILTDMMMSEMNGLELCAELRTRDELKRAAIIMVSAKTDEHWHNRATEAGADGFIEKPLSPETFVADVEKIIADAEAMGGDAAPAPEQPLPGRR